jgi:hypothetical protein
MKYELLVTAKHSPGGIQYLVTQYPDTDGQQHAKYREIDQGGSKCGLSVKEQNIKG